MLDHILILHKSGLLLFLHTFAHSSSTQSPTSPTPASPGKLSASKQRDVLLATVNKFLSSIFLTPTHNNKEEDRAKAPPVINGSCIAHYTTPITDVIVLGVMQGMLAGDETVSVANSEKRSVEWSVEGSDERGE